MLLPSLITQLTGSLPHGTPDAADDEPDGHDKQAEASSESFLIDDGTVAVRRGKKIVLTCRPGHVSRLIIDRLGSRYPVSGRHLMDEYGLPMGTAMSAIARLVKLGLITLESGRPGRKRFDQTYQLSERFAEAIMLLDNTPSHLADWGAS